MQDIYIYTNQIWEVLLPNAVNQTPCGILWSLLSLHEYQ
jgi:hypothetical protein